MTARKMMGQNNHNSILPIPVNRSSRVIGRAHLMNPDFPSSLIAYKQKK